jgi:uncharacterized protein Veg
LNIEIAKNKIRLLLNDKIKIKVYLGRNKYEYYEGYISKMHPNIFTINTNKGIKTFAYTDILIKNVVISKFN